MFWDYLKSRLKVLILLIVVEGIFVSSYFLFDLPALTVLYPLILSSVAILIAGVIDFLIVYNKHVRLKRNDFPQASGPLEKDYLEIINKLQ